MWHKQSSNNFSLLILLVCSLKLSEAYMDPKVYKTFNSFRECFGKSNAGLCFKEKALDAINETIMSPKPISFYGIVDVERNPNYNFNLSEGQLPLEVEARSMALTDVLHDKIEEYFKSRTFKFNMDTAVEEGRKKGGGGGGGGKKGGGMMMMMAIGASACMMAQMFMGKVAFIAGTALIIAKIALFLSGIIGLKKLSGGGGGGESHVVYADGGGGGGWHRSLNNEAQNLAYRAHMNENGSGNNYGGY